MIFHPHTPRGDFNMPQKNLATLEVGLFAQEATLIEYSLLMRRIKNALTGALDSAQMCFAEYLSGLD